MLAQIKVMERYNFESKEEKHMYRFSFDSLKDAGLKIRGIVCIVLPSLMFAICMALGNAFEYDGSLKPANRIRDAAGYFIIFLIVLAMLYKLLDRLKICNENAYMPERKTLLGKYIQSLKKHTFATAFVTIFIIYIPYMAISYPAIHMGDTCNQLAQGYNFSEGTSEYLNLIDENVRLNGHHPIIHTLYMHLCMLVGNRIFASWNMGIFLVSITQAICTISVISYSLSVMIKAHASRTVALATMSYFVLSPRIQNYMFLITKDVFAACALLIMCVSIWQIQKSDNAKPPYIIFTISAIFFGFLRNDGKYIVFVSLIFLLISERGKIKGMILCAAIIMSAFIMLFDVIMPAFKITPASRREALSLPFQQTARYIRDYRGGGIT